MEHALQEEVPEMQKQGKDISGQSLLESRTVLRAFFWTCTTHDREYHNGAEHDPQVELRV